MQNRVTTSIHTTKSLDERGTLGSSEFSCENPASIQVHTHCAQPSSNTYHKYAPKRPNNKFTKSTPQFLVKEHRNCSRQRAQKCIAHTINIHKTGKWRPELRVTSQIQTTHQCNRHCTMGQLLQKEHRHILDRKVGSPTVESLFRYQGEEGGNLPWERPEHPSAVRH